MASRKPNMLEAFQHSARAAQEAAAAEARESKRAPKANAPAEPVKPATVKAAPAKSAPRTPVGFEALGEDLLGTHPRPTPGIPAWLPIGVVVLLVAMAGTYWFTRNLGREAQAGGDGNDATLNEEVREDLRALQDEPVTEAPPVEVPEDTGSGLTDDDRRFLDPANRFTVRAIEYPNTASGRQLAEKAYLHLRAAGLPAIWPVTRGGVAVVCVGAEPSRGGRLDQIKEQLRDLDGPPPQNQPRAFADPYDVNIDDWIDR